MHSNQVLLLFLPIELFTLEFARILYFLTFLLKSLMSKIVDFLDVMNILFPLMLRVIINLERALWPHEVWICLRVVIGRYLLPIERQPYYCSHIIWCVMHSILNKFIQSLVFSIKVVRGLIESIHIFLTPGHIGWRNVISRLEGLLFWSAFCLGLGLGWFRVAAHYCIHFTLAFSSTQNVSPSSSLRVQLSWSRFDTS